jgi:hypothetical protein
LIYLSFNNNVHPLIVKKLKTILINFKPNSSVVSVNSNFYFSFNFFTILSILSVFLIIVLFQLEVFCVSDHTNFWKINPQDPITPIAYGIIKLHDHILFFLVVITFIVGYLLYSTYLKFYYGELNND